MLRRGVRIQLLLFVAMALAGVAFVGAKYAGLGSLVGGKGCTISADFPDSGGIFSNAEVTYNGVGVGKVGQLHLLNDGVRVDLQLESCRKAAIPNDAVAVVANRSAVGEQYVDLRPGRTSGPYLQAGAVLPMNRNRIPIATEILLTNLDRLVRSVDPDQLSTVITELGKAFNGRGPDLQRLLDSGDQLITAAQQALPETLQLIDQAGGVLQTQLDEGSAIASWAKNLNLLSAQLKRSDPDLRRLLDSGPDALSQLTGFIQQNRSDLGVLLGNLTTVGQVLTTRIAGLEELFIAYPPVVAGGYTVLADGNAHFGLVLNFDDPPPCVAGYGGTKKRLPSDTGPSTTNTGAQCTLPRGSKTSVRGAQNGPDGVPPYTGGGGTVYPRATPGSTTPGSTGAASVRPAAIGDVSSSGQVLGDNGWLALLTAGLS